MAAMAEQNSCVAGMKEGACLEPGRSCGADGSRGADGSLEARQRGAERCWQARLAPPQPCTAGGAGSRGMADSPSKAVF